MQSGELEVTGSMCGGEMVMCEPRSSRQYWGVRSDSPCKEKKINIDNV